MYANQLLAIQEDYFVCHRPASHITFPVAAKWGKKIEPSVIFFLCKVCTTSATCSQPCSHRELLCGWPHIPKEKTRRRRISPQGLINLAHNYSSPWQILLSDVPLMWKPASQLQCWAWLTWAQRGRRLNAGSFITLHSGGAASGRGHD